LAYLPI